MKIKSREKKNVASFKSKSRVGAKKWKLHMKWKWVGLFWSLLEVYLKILWIYGGKRGLDAKIWSPGIQHESFDFNLILPNKALPRTEANFYI